MTAEELPEDSESYVFFEHDLIKQLRLQEELASGMTHRRTETVEELLLQETRNMTQRTTAKRPNQDPLEDVMVRVSRLGQQAAKLSNEVHALEATVHAYLMAQDQKND